MAKAAMSPARKPIRVQTYLWRPAQSISHTTVGPTSMESPIHVKAHDLRAPSAPAEDKMKKVDGKYTSPRRAKADSKDRRRPRCKRLLVIRSLIMSKPPTARQKANTTTR